MSRRRMLAARRRVDDAWYLAGGAPMPVAAYQPLGAASLAASYVNLASPGTFDAAPGVAPTHSGATGWGFDGTTQYLTTGIVPDSGWTALVRFSGLVFDDNFRVMFGVNSTTAGRRFLIGVRDSVSGLGAAYGAGSILYVSPTLTGGVLAISGQQGYRNGGADGGAIAPWGGTTANSIFIGVTNVDGSPISFQAHNQQALAIYSSTLTAPQVAAVSAAMAALT